MKRNRLFRNIAAAALAASLAIPAAAAHAAAGIDDPIAVKGYNIDAARNSLINPHNQINDEGEIIWTACLVCHTNTPDLDKERSINDAQLRHDDDMRQICWKCHPVRVHPGAEGMAIVIPDKKPNHLIIPPSEKKLNMRLSAKEAGMILPLEPKSGKIFCATCHNPHERGLLAGAADTGADHRQRLRSAGVDVCQFCHRK